MLTWPREWAFPSGNFRCCFVFTDNMDKISGFGWKCETLPAHLRLAVVATGDIWAGHEGDAGALARRRAIIEISTDRTPAPDRPAKATARSERDRHCGQIRTL